MRKMVGSISLYLLARADVSAAIGQSVNRLSINLWVSRLASGVVSRVVVGPDGGGHHVD